MTVMKENIVLVEFVKHIYFRLTEELWVLVTCLGATRRVQLLSSAYPMS